MYILLHCSYDAKSVQCAHVNFVDRSSPNIENGPKHSLTPRISSCIIAQTIGYRHNSYIYQDNLVIIVHEAILLYSRAVLRRKLCY